LFFIPIFIYALQKTRKELGRHQIPLVGIMTAFVFGAQMLNFPVTGGTSGHLIGATVVAIFLGPWAMIVVMSCVVGVQAIVFQDGGMLALGCNIINMGVISGLIGYAIYIVSKRWMTNTTLSQLMRAGIGAWFSVVVASIATALQLAMSGTSPLAVVLPAMIAVHMLIGIGEAVITITTLIFVQQTHPNLLEARTGQGGMRWMVVGYIIALLLVFVSPLANPNPDGLERIAEDHGFLEVAQAPIYTLLPDYTVPFIENEGLTTIFAGVIGVIVVSVLGVYLVRRKPTLPKQASD
jgi:cobalt/nickel transport system permease protein